jgi:hypothetical protein
MKNILRRFAVLCVLATTALVGCDTDIEGPAQSSKASLLTALPWHITAWTRSTGSAAATNYLNTAMPSSCERDDRYEFLANGTMNRREGPTSCGSGTSQTIVSNSPWNFNAAQTTLTIGSANMGTTTITYDVVRLTSDVMDLRYTRTSGGTTIVDNISYRN